MIRQERREGIHRIVDTRILGKCEFYVTEDDHRAVGTVALEFSRLRKPDGIVEGQTEGFVDILTALALEQVLLEVIKQREEHAALKSQADKPTMS